MVESAASFLTLIRSRKRERILSSLALHKIAVIKPRPTRSRPDKWEILLNPNITEC